VNLTGEFAGRRTSCIYNHPPRPGNEIVTRRASKLCCVATRRCHAHCLRPSHNTDYGHEDIRNICSVSLEYIGLQWTHLHSVVQKIQILIFKLLFARLDSTSEPVWFVCFNCSLMVWMISNANFDYILRFVHVRIWS
jgi:hypothetical protein